MADALFPYAVRSDHRRGAGQELRSARWLRTYDMFASDTSSSLVAPVTPSSAHRSAVRFWLHATTPMPNAAASNTRRFVQQVRARAAPPAFSNTEPGTSPSGYSALCGVPIAVSASQRTQAPCRSACRTRPTERSAPNKRSTYVLNAISRHASDRRREGRREAAARRSQPRKAGSIRENGAPS